MAVLAAIAVAAGAAAVRGRDRKVAGANGWARRRDLRRLTIYRRSSGRLVLGRPGRRLVATEQRHSVLVVGPTQSGKTTGLAVPAILEWEGPVVATSVKSDLLADTYWWRRELGDVWVYDPTTVTKFRRATWSPLAACATWQGARRTAGELADAARVASGKGVENSEFWFSAAAKLLGPYLFAAAAGGATVADVVRWIDSQERVEARRILEATGQREALAAHDAAWKRDDRTRSSIFTTTEAVLSVYADPGVAASARTSEIATQRLLDGGGHTLYLTSPPNEQRRLRPLFATLVSEVMNAAYAKVASTGRPLDPPLLVVLDEAANIAPVPDLATIASTAASHGIQLVTVWQDLAQLRARYGHEASTILNNHRAKIVLSGVGDLDTLDYFSRLAGDQELGNSLAPNGLTNRRSSTGEGRSRRLIAPEGVRQLRTGRGVLIYGNLPPAQLKLRPWFKNRRLKHRASAGDGHNETTNEGASGSVEPSGAQVVPIRTRSGRREAK